jgi:lysophospholipase L1-like esterase
MIIKLQAISEMKNRFAGYYPALISLMLMAFLPLIKDPVKLYLVGDSTMANKEIRAYPETGWGMPFRYFFDSTVVVENHAKNGRSTKSFRQENLWEPIRKALKPGDYVFIQFGHNDEVPTKIGSYTTTAEFKNNLAQYVGECKRAKAIPILLTPVARRSFDANGKLIDTHPVYGNLVKEVAMSTNTTLIDLQKLSEELLQQFGVEGSKHLFLHLEPGEHPNYPNGKVDNTHFSELGARKMAQLVLAEIRKLEPDLAKRIINH